MSLLKGAGYKLITLEKIQPLITLPESSALRSVLKDTLRSLKL